MAQSEFEKVTQVVKKLRDPEGGCPWDLKQTHESLLKYLIEECYEFLHATEIGDPKQMKDELGDVLLQVLLHSVIAEEKNHFSVDDVCQNLREKLVRRHPHVFGDGDSDIDAEGVVKNWEEIKKQEKKNNKNNEAPRIDESYLKFPALFSAYKIGKKTNKLNFDWDDAYQVTYKVEEEWQELKEELAPGVTPNKERVTEELGDFLFSVAQLARHLGVQPEEALRAANKKFVRRFGAMEKLMAKDNLRPEEMTQAEMDKYWDEMKIMEKK